MTCPRMGTARTSQEQRRAARRRQPDAAGIAQQQRARARAHGRGVGRQRPQRAAVEQVRGVRADLTSAPACARLSCSQEPDRRATRLASGAMHALARGRGRGEERVRVSGARGGASGVARPSRSTSASRSAQGSSNEGLDLAFGPPSAAARRRPPPPSAEQDRRDEAPTVASAMIRGAAAGRSDIEDLRALPSTRMRASARARAARTRAFVGAASAGMATVFEQRVAGARRRRPRTRSRARRRAAARPARAGERDLRSCCARSKSRTSRPPGWRRKLPSAKVRRGGSERAAAKRSARSSAHGNVAQHHAPRHASAHERARVRRADAASAAQVIIIAAAEAGVAVGVSALEPTACVVRRTRGTGQRNARARTSTPPW